MIILHSAKDTHASLPTDNLLANRDNVKITEFPTDDGNLTLLFGESVNLTCSGVTTRSLTQFFWVRGSRSLVCPVREDPFCVPSNRSLATSCQPSGGCRIDTRRGRRCKGLRVHSYVFGGMENCTYGVLRKTAMMVINNITWSDSGIYTCIHTTPGNKNNRTMYITVGKYSINYIYIDPHSYSQLIV